MKVNMYLFSCGDCIHYIDCGGGDCGCTKKKNVDPADEPCELFKMEDVNNEYSIILGE